MTEVCLPAMGGTFTYLCFPQMNLSAGQCRDLFHEAHKEVLRIERKFTDFKDSPFNRINESAGCSPCPVDDEIIALIDRSLEISEYSEGRFDIGHASVGHAWRRARAENRPLSPDEKVELGKLVDYKKIVVDRKEKTVFLPHKNMRIGLGGIGKGHAVDRAFDFLEREGLYNFHVNGSGDIRFHSHKDAPRKWRVGIRNPLCGDPTKQVGIIQIAGGSVSTSGNYVQFNLNKNDHHIMATGRGSAGRNIISATVITNSCVESDTSATILMNMNDRDAWTFMKERDLMAVVINQSGRTLLSPRATSCFGM